MDRYLHTMEVTYYILHILRKVKNNKKKKKNRRMADSFPACLVYTVYDELVMSLAIEIQKYFLKVTEFYKHWTYSIYQRAFFLQDVKY